MISASSPISPGQHCRRGPAVASRTRPLRPRAPRAAAPCLGFFILLNAEFLWRCRGRLRRSHSRAVPLRVDATELKPKNDIQRLVRLLLVRPSSGRSISWPSCSFPFGGAKGDAPAEAVCKREHVCGRIKMFSDTCCSLKSRHLPPGRHHRGNRVAKTPKSIDVGRNDVTRDAGSVIDRNVAITSNE